MLTILRPGPVPEACPLSNAAAGEGMRARGSQLAPGRTGRLPPQRGSPCFPTYCSSPSSTPPLPVPVLLEAERHFGNSLLLARPFFPLPPLGHPVTCTGLLPLPPHPRMALTPLSFRCDVDKSSPTLRQQGEGGAGRVERGCFQREQ